MKTATRVIVDLPYDWEGEARLYRIDPPMSFIIGESRLSSTEYVVVSTAITEDEGPNTLIFPAKENGEVLDWLDLPGSFAGDLDFDKALRDAGYQVIE